MPTSPSRRAYRPTVMVDLPCTECGYNLKGTIAGSPCPECGSGVEAVRSSAEPARFRVPLAESPLRWLRRFRAGATLLVGGSCAILLASPALLVWALFPAVAFAGLLWWLGVVLVTTSRPGPAVPEGEDPASEWLVIRTVSRLTQCAWFAFGVAGVLAGTGLLSQGPVTPIVLGTTLAIGWLGLLPLCVFLSDMAQWGRDTGLANRMLTTVWVIGSVSGLSLLVLVVLLTGGRTSAGGASPFAGPVGIGGLVLLSGCGLLIFIRALELQRLASWAIRDRTQAEGRLDRLREKAARAEQD